MLNSQNHSDIYKKCVYNEYIWNKINVSGFTFSLWENMLSHLS